jgi:hypothetical protein
VKNRLTVTSVGLSKVALNDEKTARTTENSIYIEKVKHDLNIKSTYSDSFYLYFNLVDFINAQNVDEYNVAVNLNSFLGTINLASFSKFTSSLSGFIYNATKLFLS